jgi:hypothetical protein
MPDGMTILVAFLVLIACVAIIVPLVRGAPEAFTDGPAASSVALYNALASDYTGYVGMGQQRYNALGATMDPRRPTFAGKQTAAANENIQRALTTTELTAATSGPAFTASETRPVPYRLPPDSGVLEQIAKCERLTGRESCTHLGKAEYQNCGICIKEGTVFDGSNPGRHIGGLYIMNEDRKRAEDAAEPGTTPLYAPTFGMCPPGSFFLAKDLCERNANRADCDEVGKSGGFATGRTAEGKRVGLEKCAQAPVAGEDVYVYEPRGRTFSANLRGITPTGTGITRVRVFRGAELIGSGETRVGGQEFTISLTNVREGDDLTIQIAQEAPYRRNGNSELFFYSVNEAGNSVDMAPFTRDAARSACERIGTALATDERLQEAFANNAQICNAAWSTTAPQSIMQEAIDSCGGRRGVLPAAAGTTNAGAWCFGAKPPKSTQTNMFATFVGDWFTRTQGSAAGQQTRWSRNGDYQAPYNRGILLQWEAANSPVTRSVAFEPTITRVNGLAPSALASDGTGVFKVLRRLGTFGNSSILLSPRPTASSNFPRNVFWIWSNQPQAQEVQFGAKVPGVLANPFYAEDLARVPRGPLLTNPESQKLLQTSQCMKPEETAGNYSVACLQSLFVGAGGDPMNGTLATQGGGLTQLNRLGSMDAIAAHLNNLYSIATRGMDLSGVSVEGATAAARTTAINNAAQQLFGFDITSPCEEIQESATGELRIVPKSGSVDAACLKYLWENTGADTSRGIGDAARALKNTYTSIGLRFSGLRKNEGSADARTRHPFRTCTPAGTLAPVDASGVTNIAAAGVALSKGSIAQIQDFYDSIHRTANDPPASRAAADLARQEEAIAQCYGIRKSPDEDIRAGCGVPARFIRVLQTGMHGPTAGKCIQIAQIQAFDANGVELARGKPTTYGTIGWGADAAAPVDGDARPRAYTHDPSNKIYHDDCTSPADVQHFTVDLGRVYNIASIKFYQRSNADDAQRQNGTPVQLLDASGKVVAQKYVGTNTWADQWRTAPEIMTFNKDDMRLQIPMAALTAGTQISLLSATSYNRYLRAPGANAAMLSSEPDSSGQYSALYTQQATFLLTPALNGNASMISLQPLNPDGYYVRITGERAYAHVREQNASYADQASFQIVPAVNGDPSMISIQQGSRYLATRRDASTEVWLTSINRTSPWDVQRASWKVTFPLA